MKAYAGAIGAIGLLAAVPSAAQQVHYWPAPARSSGSTMTYFHMGTPVVLRTRTEVNTKQAKPGDRIYLEVAESLTYRGQVVVPVGAPAVAEVARSERNGHFGKRGEIVLRLLYAETPFGPVRLTGQAGGRGRSGVAASVATMAFVSPLGFLIHGTSGRLPFGTTVTGYLDEPLRFVSAPVEPVVAAAAAVQPDRPAMLPVADGPGFTQ